MIVSYWPVVLRTHDEYLDMDVLNRNCVIEQIAFSNLGQDGLVTAESCAIIGLPQVDSCQRPQETLELRESLRYGLSRFVLFVIWNLSCTIWNAKILVEKLSERHILNRDYPVWM